ncbi:MAG TPA: helix-turn-helix transcriptional regulator [Atribacterota bacterium]|nr:helix-turn-helix transcriptional regulator [Atribacterota bacterium]
MSKGYRVKEERELQKITQSELSIRTGLTQKFISELENDKYSSISDQTMEILAQALNKTVPELFYNEEKVA